MLNNCVQKNDEYLIFPVFVDEKGHFTEIFGILK